MLGYLVSISDSSWAILSRLGAVMGHLGTVSVGASGARCAQDFGSPGSWEPRTMGRGLASMPPGLLAVLAIGGTRRVGLGTPGLFF